MACCSLSMSSGRFELVGLRRTPWSEFVLWVLMTGQVYGVRVSTYCFHSVLCDMRRGWHRNALRGMSDRRHRRRRLGTDRQWVLLRLGNTTAVQQTVSRSRRLSSTHNQRVEQRREHPTWHWRTGGQLARWSVESGQYSTNSKVALWSTWDVAKWLQFTALCASYSQHGHTNSLSSFFAAVPVVWNDLPAHSAHRILEHIRQSPLDTINFFSQV